MRALIIFQDPTPSDTESEPVVQLFDQDPVTIAELGEGASRCAWLVGEVSEV
jgi:hypothetical protein